MDRMLRLVAPALGVLGSLVRVVIRLTLLAVQELLELLGDPVLAALQLQAYMVGRTALVEMLISLVVVMLVALARQFSDLLKGGYEKVNVGWTSSCAYRLSSGCWASVY
jgi:hypothetical protein